MLDSEKVRTELSVPDFLSRLIELLDGGDDDQKADAAAIIGLWDIDSSDEEHWKMLEAGAGKVAQLIITTESEDVRVDCLHAFSELCYNYVPMFSALMAASSRLDSIGSMV
jgi:hypothetical protein